MTSYPPDNVAAIDAIVYASADMDLARRFFSDWGLRLANDSAEGLVFECGDGGQIIVREETAADLPARLADGSRFREVIWGVASQASLDRLGSELARDRDVSIDASGTLHSVDDSGIHLGFRISRSTIRHDAPEVAFNTPGNRARIDERAAIYERASPWRIGHIGFRVADVERAERFYVDRLGFWLSDRYAEGGATFLRHARRSDHHNLYITRSPTDRTMLHHVAFEVRDIHEVFGGGMAFSKKGWATHVGPGRHPVSSAYFWYFKNPLGGAIEYFSDTDIVTESWSPVDFPEARFSEWHLPDGIPEAAPGSMRSSIEIARELSRRNR